MQKQAKEHFRFCGSLCLVYILRLKFQSTLSFSAGWQRPRRHSATASPANNNSSLAAGKTATFSCVSIYIYMYKIDVSFFVRHAK
jgi:hypothetical protein